MIGTTGSAGAAGAAIYAVNEDPSKDVGDVTVAGNEVDCLGATSVAVFGIQVGAYGALAIPSGSFVVSANTVRHTHEFSSSAAIVVSNPSAGSATDQVVVVDNAISDGCGSGQYIINMQNSGVPINKVVIAGNNLDTPSTSLGGVAVLQAVELVVADNLLVIRGGNPTYGLYSGATRSTFVGNHIQASVSTSNAIPNGSVLRGNLLNGSALTETAIVVSTDVQALRYVIGSSGVVTQFGQGDPTSVDKPIATLFVDTFNNKLWVKMAAGTGTAWKSVALT